MMSSTPRSATHCVVADSYSVYREAMSEASYTRRRALQVLSGEGE